MQKVSIILTTYNCEEHLTTTLDSILMQDYDDIEIIIKDGGSADDTINIISSYESNSRYPIKWQSSPDKGLYDAMNKGYVMSTGEIIQFFNDQFIDRQAVSKMVKAIDSGEYEGAHADLIYATDEKVIRYWHNGQGKIRNGWMPGHPTLFLKRSVYERYGLYDTNMGISADYDLMLRILKDGDIRLAYVPETIIRMYYGGVSTSGASGYINSIREALSALKKNAIPFPYYVIVARTIRTVPQFLFRHNKHGIDALLGD